MSDFDDIGGIYADMHFLETWDPEEAQRQQERKLMDFLYHDDDWPLEE